MKTGFSLLEMLHRENPVLIAGMGLQSVFPTTILRIVGLDLFYKANVTVPAMEELGKIFY